LITNPESPVLIKVTVSPDTALFESSLTVIEIVAVDEPSAGIDPELTEIFELLVFALLFANTGKAKRMKKKEKDRINTKNRFFISDIKLMLTGK